MRVEVSLSREFIPEWNENRDLPPDEQCVIIHKAPSIALKEKLLPRTQIKYKFDADGVASGGEANLRVDRQGILKGMITEIKNLCYVNNGTDHYITNSHGFFKESTPTVFDGLIDELVSHFQTILSAKVDEKN